MSGKRSTEFEGFSHALKRPRPLRRRRKANQFLKKLRAARFELQVLSRTVRVEKWPDTIDTWVEKLGKSRTGKGLVRKNLTSVIAAKNVTFSPIQDKMLCVEFDYHSWYWSSAWPIAELREFIERERAKASVG